MNLMIPEITIEECAEVIQAITKYQRFGPEKEGYDNAYALAKEIGQLKYMLEELEVFWCLDSTEITNGYREKSHRLMYYAQYNVCNQTQPEPTAK